MKLHSKILVDSHYRQFWRDGQVLPDPYPPDHPKSSCYRCYRLWHGAETSLTRLTRCCCKPTRRSRTKVFLVTGACLFGFMYLLQGLSLASPHYRASHRVGWMDGGLLSRLPLLGALVGGHAGDIASAARNHKRSVQDTVFAPDCDALLKGDFEEVKYTKKLLYREVRDSIDDAEYPDMTRNCSAFRIKHRFHNGSTSEDDKFPLAFVVSVDKNAEQVSRLLMSIYAPHHAYCFCARLKSSKSFQKAIRSVASCFHNVVVVNANRWNKTHEATEAEAAIDDIKCDRRCVHYLLERFTQWKYLLKIHGQDFPLITTAEIVSRLRSISRQNVSVVSDYAHLERKHDVVLRLPAYAKALPSGDTSDSGHVVVDRPQVSEHVMLWKGSAYFLASRPFLQRFCEENLTYHFAGQLSGMTEPEMFYWPTLFLRYLNDSQKATQLAVSSRHFSLMADKKLPTTHFCSAAADVNPYCLFDVEDLHKMLRPRQGHQALFAHALDLDHDHVAFKCLERRHQQLLQQQESTQALHALFVEEHEAVRDEKLVLDRNVYQEKVLHEAEAPVVLPKLQVDGGKLETGSDVGDESAAAHQEKTAHQGQHHHQPNKEEAAVGGDEFGGSDKDTIDEIAEGSPDGDDVPDARHVISEVVNSILGDHHREGHEDKETAGGEAHGGDTRDRDPVPTPSDNLEGREDHKPHPHHHREDKESDKEGVQRHGDRQDMIIHETGNDPPVKVIETGEMHGEPSDAKEKERHLDTDKEENEMKERDDIDKSEKEAKLIHELLLDEEKTLRINKDTQPVDTEDQRESIANEDLVKTRIAHNPQALKIDHAAVEMVGDNRGDHDQDNTVNTEEETIPHNKHHLDLVRDDTQRPMLAR